jgi:hypothetical protein
LFLNADEGSQPESLRLAGGDRDYICRCTTQAEQRADAASGIGRNTWNF